MFSEKILFLITSTLLLQLGSSFGQFEDEATEPHGQLNQIRGLPELDYPTYYSIPKTSFRCSDQLYNPGFYADTESRCQAFHLCYEHRQESFLCPMGTIFNQPILACDYWYSSNCSLAPSYYHVNADKRNEEYHGEVDEPIDRQSDDLFDKMAHLYEINQLSDTPIRTKNSDIPEIELLGRDDESSGEPSNEESNKADDYNKYSYDNQFNTVEHPELFRYEARDLNGINMHKISANEQLSEMDEKDLIFSEDGMLHPSQEGIYEMYPTDQNFDQGYSGYAEIPSQDFSYDLNEDLDLLSSAQVTDFELQKRNAVVGGDYVRRPLNRKPVIVIPEEPEVVKLPVLKHKRKPIGIASTISTNADRESVHEADNDSIYEEAATVVNLEGTTSVEFPPDKSNSDLYAYELRDPNLFYEIQEEINDEDSELHQADNLDANDGFSNNEEISPNVFGSGSHDPFSIANVEHRSTIVDSNYGDESEILMEHFKGSTELPVRSSETNEDEISFDSDPFLGSGSEKNINQPLSSDEFSFPEDPYIFSDSEDAEIDTEKSYELPMNLPDTFEGSGIYVQEAADIPDLIEEVNEPIQFVLDDSEDLIYRKESSFPSESFGRFTPLANNEEAALVPDGSGGTSELNYEFQETSDDSQDGSDKETPESNGFYVLSDSEYNFNNEYEDSSGYYSKSVDYIDSSNFKDISDEIPEDLNVNNESLVPTDDPENDTQHNMEYQDSKHSEHTYEKLFDEFETETLSKISEENTIDSGSDRHLSTDDLKYLEIKSQNQSQMLSNLFDVSNEKSISEDIKDEIISPSQNIEEQAAKHEDSHGMKREYEFENVSVDASSDEHIEQQAAKHEDSHGMEREYEFENVSVDVSSDEHIEQAAKHEDSHGMERENEFENVSVDVSSDEHSSVVEQMTQISNMDGSDQGGSETFLPQQEWEVFVSGKEPESFNSLSAENDRMFSDGPESKQKLSLKAPPIKPKNGIVSENAKIVARGKRFNDNLQIFNPVNTGNVMAPSRETFRETMFTNIPSAFLKMKHSTLRPYFYNYGLQNAGYNPRTGDISEFSTLSKLTTLGKRLLTAKKSKFNRMKKYIDSYRNN